MSKITGTDVQKMVGHWLQTPTNGYLGSDYGQDAKSLLQRPQHAGEADAYLAKLREDVPALSVLPVSAVNLYGVHHDVDKLDIMLEVAGSAFEIG